MGFKLILLNQALKIAQASFDKAAMAGKQDLADKLSKEIIEIENKIKRIQDKENELV